MAKAISNLGAIHQNGSGILLFFLILGVGMLALITPLLGKLASRDPADEISAATLKAGTVALMSWALTRRDDRRAPPGMLPYPDRHSDGNYDGQSDCPPNPGTPSTNHNLRLGRLPTVGEPSGTPCEGEDFGTGRRIMLGFDDRDGNGDALWYAVSQNLVDDTRARAYLGNISNHRSLTPMALRAKEAGAQWLTVCDSLGNILSREVAFVLISPGKPLADQDRSRAAPPPADFLDKLTLPSSAAPCTGSISHQRNQLIFIASTATTQFNDRISYVTRNQFIEQLTLRALASMRGELDRFVTAHPDIGYPHPGTTLDGTCSPALQSGRLPIKDGTDCIGLGGWPSWDTPSASSSWHAITHYQRVSANEIELSIAGCADTFRLRRATGSSISTIQRDLRQC